MYSLDFDLIEKLQQQEKWDELTSIMIKAAQDLEKVAPILC